MKLPRFSVHRSLWLGLLALSATPLPAVAQQTTIVRYTFNGLTGAPSATAPGVSAGVFMRDPADATFYDNSAGNPAPDANSSDWTTTPVLDTTLFYTFTVTPGAGGTSWNALTFDAARFDIQGINDGPASFAVRSSLDNFTATLLSGSIGTAFAGVTVPLNVRATNPVEYRIYGYNAGSTQGIFQIDNVALTVPEPGTVAAGLLAAGVVAVAARRRSRSSNA